MNQYPKNTFLLTVLVMMLGGNLMSQNRLKDRYIRSEKQNYTDILYEFEQQELSEIDSEEELFNYYLVQLFANFRERSKSVQIKKRENILGRLKSIASTTSFEANFIDYLHHGYTEYGITALKKAYEIDPTRNETWDDLLGYYEVVGDRENAKKIAVKIKDNSKYEKSIYDYSNNLIASTNGPSIIFTQGELDTYPLLVLKYTEGLKNILPVNLNLLENDSYRQQFLNEIGSNDIQFKPNNLKAFMEKLEQKHPNYKLYLGLTVNRKFLDSIKNNLYLSGLVFQFSSSAIANIQICADIFKYNQFSKNYIFNKKLDSPESNDLHRNYLPFLSLLENRKELLSDKEFDKLKMIKQNILNRLK